jgi:hypothetical protein
MPSAPKRSDEKMGRPHSAAGNPNNVDRIEFEHDLTIPEPGEDWSPIALYAWEAYKSSPGALYYSDTDIAFGWITCEAINVAVRDGSAMKMAAADSMMRAALFNEADRRKARIEYTRKPVEAHPDVDKNVSDFMARRGRTA